MAWYDTLFGRIGGWFRTRPAAPELPVSGVARVRTAGGVGTKIAAGILRDDDFNPEVRSTNWYGRPGEPGFADKMIRDPHVRMSLSYIGGPIRAGLWQFIPASDDVLDVEIADFCQWAFIERHDWDSVIRLALTSLRYGFSLLELTDDAIAVSSKRFPSHPGQGRGIVPTGFHHRPAWSLHRWLQAEENPAKLAGIQQWLQGSDTEPAGLVTIPSDRLLRWTVEQEGADFAGLALLRSSYGAYKLKIAFQTIWAMKHERNGLGVPTIELAEDPEEKDVAAAMTALAEMRAHEKGSLVLPYGYKFSWNNASSSDGTNLEAAIEICNRDIAVNVCAGFMNLGNTSGSTGGSYALAETQAGQLELFIELWARFIVAPFNLAPDWAPNGVGDRSPVERYVRLNYGSGHDLPLLACLNLPTTDWSKVLPVLAQLAAQKIVTPSPWLEAEVLQRMRLYSPRRWRPGATANATPPERAAA